MLHKQLTSYKRCIVIKTFQSNTEFERHNFCTVILLYILDALINHIQKLAVSLRYFDQAFNEQDLHGEFSKSVEQDCT